MAIKMTNCHFSGNNKLSPVNVSCRNCGYSKLYTEGISFTGGIKCPKCGSSSVIITGIRQEV